MKRGQTPRQSKPKRRRTSPPRNKRIVLRPGQRLETATVIVTARKRPEGGGGGVTVDVSCACTASEPNTPDCKPVTTKSPGGDTIRVKCNKTGGCKKCKETTTTTSIGFMA
jgi:hypothetical protein